MIYKSIVLFPQCKSNFMFLRNYSNNYSNNLPNFLDSTYNHIVSLINIKKTN